MEGSPAGTRTLFCVHCGQRLVIVQGIADDDVVLVGVLAAHLRLRHPAHFTLHDDDPHLADVLRHFASSL